MAISPEIWAARLGNLAGWRRRLAAVVCGALAAVALPPIGVVIALVPAFTGLLWLAGDARGRQAFAAGWWFGFGHFAVGLYWVGSAFFVDAALYGWLAPLAVTGLAAGMALFPALAMWTGQEVSGRLGLRIWARALVLAVAWTACEWLRGQMLTGFPWNLIGSVWVAHDSVLQSAAWVGVFGLSLLSIVAATLPAVLADGFSVRRSVIGLAGIVLLGALAVAGGMRLQAASLQFVDGVRLRLVQPNIAQHLKWKPDLRIGHVRRQLEMSTQLAANGAPPTHVIWPETSVPFNLASDRALQKVLGRAAPPGGLLIAGAPSAEGAPGAGQKLWNSAHAVSPQGEIVATYNKQHLVPFGEYVPFRQILKFSKLTAGRLDFSFGAGPRIIDLPGLPPAAFLICYEVIFPDEVPGHAADGRKRPGWLLNLTNDAWFGDTAGPHQHLAAARMRAAEHGVALVRVANTGISAVIDPYGRVLQSLPLGEAGVLDAALPEALDATVFANFGSGLALLLTLGGLALAVLFGRRP
ncbi:MAG: apolipoprotein N-acyltransferase [Rhodospirillaceae bacterium]|nr:apolipoprotein N-acyltransferase [Rhodospirillaceae bacterium]